MPRCAPPRLRFSGGCPPQASSDAGVDNEDSDGGGVHPVPQLVKGDSTLCPSRGCGEMIGPEMALLLVKARLPVAERGLVPGHTERGAHHPGLGDALFRHTSAAVTASFVASWRTAIASP